MPPTDSRYDALHKRFPDILPETEDDPVLTRLVYDLDAYMAAPVPTHQQQRTERVLLTETRQHMQGRSTSGATQTTQHQVPTTAHWRLAGHGGGRADCGAAGGHAADANAWNNQRTRQLFTAQRSMCARRYQNAFAREQRIWLYHYALARRGLGLRSRHRSSKRYPSKVAHLTL